MTSIFKLKCCFKTLLKKALADMRQEIDRERKERENTIRRMKQMDEQMERERMEKENAIQLMLNEVKQKEEQLERERKEKDREIAELKNQLSRASLLTPLQVK
jgi:hypothetical protein